MLDMFTARYVDSAFYLFLRRADYRPCTQLLNISVYFTQDNSAILKESLPGTPILQCNYVVVAVTAEL